MKISILIVGGSGYLGRNLISVLDSNRFEVTITGIEKTVELTFKEVKYIQLYLGEELTYSNLNFHYDIIIIMASTMNGLGRVDLTNMDITTNVFDLMKFLNFINENKLGENLIYISSMTVYCQNNQSPVAENSNKNPLSVYGLSKLLAEEIFTFFCQSHKLSGVIFRLPGIYGRDRKGGFIYNTIKKLSAGEFVKLNTKNLGYWETIYIDDLILMILKFIDTYTWKDKFNIYNFSYGQETDFYETATFIAQKLGRLDNILIDEKRRGYKKFYLSNKNLKQLFQFHFDYYTSLQKYILQNIQ